MAFLLLQLKLLVDGDVSQCHQLAVFVIEVDFATRNSDLSILLRLLGTSFVLHIV